MNEGFCTALIRFHLGTGNHLDTWESNMENPREIWKSTIDFGDFPTETAIFRGFP
jgi:hypothetical protein